MNKLIAILLLSFAFLQANAQNLITNPDAEAGPPASNGWTAVVSGTSCHFVDGWRHEQNINHFGAAHGGSYMFYSGCNNEGHLYQDIDVSGYVGAIDAGGAEFTFTGWTRSHDQGASPDDERRIVIEYRDAANTTVLDSYDSGKMNTTTWIQTTDVRMAPVGTRTVRINLYSYLNTGPSVDGYFDDLSFTTSALLPVELTDFRVYPANDKEVGIQWQTASETGNSHFSVERSINGESWKSIGVVAGAVNSYEGISYHFMDKSPVYGTALYRLKQVDVDGTFSFSPIRSIVRKDDDVSIKVFPNPANGILNISLEEEIEGEVFLINSIGQVVYSQRLRGEDLSLIDTDQFSKGIYFVKIQTEHTRVYQQSVFFE